MTSEGYRTLLAKLGTAVVSDALDRLGIVGQCLGIRPLSVDQPMVGPAYTVGYLPVGDGGGTVGDYIDDVSPGDVVALDNQGRLDATVWGDLLTMTASARNVAGTVIDGVCRDLASCRRHSYPLFARSNWMRTGKDRVYAARVGEPVSIGGVLVAAGDVLYGDEDGVLAIPRRRLDDVLAVASEIAEREMRIRSAVQQGQALADARSEVGYHQLQTRGVAHA